MLCLRSIICTTSTTRKTQTSADVVKRRTAIVVSIRAAIAIAAIAIAVATWIVISAAGANVTVANASDKGNFYLQKNSPLVSQWGVFCHIIICR